MALALPPSPPSVRVAGAGGQRNARAAPPRAAKPRAQCLRQLAFVPPSRAAAGEGAAMRRASSSPLLLCPQPAPCAGRRRSCLGALLACAASAAGVHVFAA